MTRAVTLFFALLAVASITTVGGAAVLAALSGRWPVAAAVRQRLAGELRGSAVVLAAVVATVATAGSLYLSEIAGFPPCTLCWVQRGFMYPLAALLCVGAWRGWRVSGARLWAVAGGAVSTFHVAVERFPSLEAGGGMCALNNPCSIRWVEHFGFVTIPVMALAAFALAAVLLSIRPHDPGGDDEPSPDRSRQEALR